MAFAKLLAKLYNRVAYPLFMIETIGIVPGCHALFLCYHGIEHLGVQYIFHLLVVADGRGIGAEEFYRFAVAFQSFVHRGELSFFELFFGIR